MHPNLEFKTAQYCEKNKNYINSVHNFENRRQRNSPSTLLQPVPIKINGFELDLSLRTFLFIVLEQCKENRTHFSRIPEIIYYTIFE